MTNKARESHPKQRSITVAPALPSAVARSS
jgi:hypothetical protein